MYCKHSIKHFLFAHSWLTETITPRNWSKKEIAERGQSDFLCGENISVAVWQDRKPMNFGSHFLAPRNIDTTARRQKDGTEKEISIRVFVKDYNMNMGGTAKNDQMIRLCRFCRHYPWPRRVTEIYCVGLLKCLCYLAQFHSWQNFSKENSISFLYEQVAVSLIGNVRSKVSWRENHARNAAACSACRNAPPQFFKGC